MEREQKPIRVLHVLGTTNLGGAESRVMELYRAMDREKVQFDFLVHTTQEGSYSAEIRQLGGKIYSLPRFKVYNYVLYKKAVENFFKAHPEFCAVHGHMTSTASIYLPIAKRVYQDRERQGMPKLITIAHARSAGVDQGIKGSVTKLLRRNLKKKADYCFTCSKEAAMAVFGEDWIKAGNVWTIPNAIDCQRFAFQPQMREQVRKELGVENQFVIGHVGRFGFMKNHAYLVEIFASLCQKREDMAMLLIGKGEEEEAIHEKLRALGETLFQDSTYLENKVQFLGNHFDVEKYYQAFDYFVFPSIFEGLPGSVAEAQAAGLHCLVSDQVTKEVALTPLVSYRSIEESPAMWAEEILRNAEQALQRNDVTQQIARQGFDVQRQAAAMENFYRTGVNPPGSMTQSK